MVSARLWSECAQQLYADVDAASGARLMCPLSCTVGPCQSRRKLRKFATVSTRYTQTEKLFAVFRVGAVGTGLLIPLFGNKKRVKCPHTEANPHGNFAICNRFQHERQRNYSRLICTIFLNRNTWVHLLGKLPMQH